MLKLLSYRTLALNSVEYLVLLHLVQVIADGCYNQLECMSLVQFIEDRTLFTL